MRVQVCDQEKTLRQESGSEGKKKRSCTEVTMCVTSSYGDDDDDDDNDVIHSWILGDTLPRSGPKDRRACNESGRVGWGQVSVVFAGVNSVPEHNYGREVVSDAGVVLDVVEPSRHIHILLLLLDGQVHYEWMDSIVHDRVS